MAEYESSDQRKQKLERRRRRAAAERQRAMSITVGGIVAVVVVLFLVWVSTRSGRRIDPKEQAAIERAQSEQVRKLAPRPVPTVLRKRPTKEQLEDRKARERRRPRQLSGDALREQINKEFDAARRRAGLYVKGGQWGKALKAYERLNDRYDDEELRLRSQPEIDELMERAADAFRDTKREAAGLAAGHRYDGACKMLLELAKSCGIETYGEDARALVAKYGQQKAEHLERSYREALAPIEAMVPEWKFEQAVAKAAALRFGTPKYQGLLAARLAELRGLMALKKKMMDVVNNAMPRVQKRAIRAPGLPGEFTDADADGLRAESRAGKETYTWMALKGEATLRLALMGGGRDDAKHRMAVLRLLVEVGYLKRAKRELEVVRRMGVDVGAIEAMLEEREDGGERTEDGREEKTKRG